mgnify:FL=1
MSLNDETITTNKVEEVTAPTKTRAVKSYALAPDDGYFALGLGRTPIVNKQMHRKNAAIGISRINEIFPVSQEQKDSWDSIRLEAIEIENETDLELKKEKEDLLQYKFQEHFAKYMTDEVIDSIVTKSVGSESGVGTNLSNFSFLNQSEQMLAGVAEVDPETGEVKYNLRSKKDKYFNPANAQILTNRDQKALTLYADDIIGAVDYKEAVNKRIILNGDIKNILNIDDIIFATEDPTYLLAFNTMRFNSTVDPETYQTFYQARGWDLFAPLGTEILLEFGIGAKGLATAGNLSVKGAGAVAKIGRKIFKVGKWSRAKTMKDAYLKTPFGKKYGENKVVNNLAFTLAGATPVRGSAAAITPYTWEEASRDTAIELAFVGVVSKGMTKLLDKKNGLNVIKKVNNAFGKGNTKLIDSLTARDIQIFRMARDVAEDELSGLAGKTTNKKDLAMLQDFLNATEEVHQLIGASEQSARKLAAMLQDADTSAITQYVKENEYFLELIQSKMPTEGVGKKKINFSDWDMKELKKARAIWNTKVNGYNNLDPNMKDDWVKMWLSGKNSKSVSHDEIIEAAQLELVEYNIIKRNNQGGFAGLNFEGLDALIKKTEGMKSGSGRKARKLKTARINAIRAAIAQELERNITVLQQMLQTGKMNEEDIVNFLYTNPEAMENFEKVFNKYLDIQGLTGGLLKSLGIPAEKISPKIQGGANQKIIDAAKSPDEYGQQLSDLFTRMLEVKKLKVDDNGKLLGLPSEYNKEIGKAIDELEALSTKFTGGIPSKYSDNQVVRLGQIMPWVMLRAAYLGRIFNRVVEPLYAGTKGILDRNYNFWSSVLRKAPIEEQTSNLRLTENWRGLMMGLRKLTNPKNRNVNRDVFICSCLAKY